MPADGGAFTRDGGLLVPTPLARGPWSRDHIHGSAVEAVLVRALESVPAPVPMVWTRITVELLRPAPMRPVQVVAEVTRAGARVQGCSATALVDGRVVARATALRMRRAALAVDADPAPRLPGPTLHDREPFGDFLDPESFASLVELRFVEGDWGMGPSTAWLRMTGPLVDGEAISPLQSLVALSDWAHGISQEVPYASHVFMNSDLTVYLERPPVGEWVGLEASTAISPVGTGLATSRIHDEAGPVGRGQQSLFVEERARRPAPRSRSTMAEGCPGERVRT